MFGPGCGPVGPQREPRVHAAEVPGPACADRPQTRPEHHCSRGRQIRCRRAPDAAARAAAAPAASGAIVVDTIAGPNSSSYKRFGISGADLGTLWDNGYSGGQRQALIAFGDTFGNAARRRKNTLFRTSTTDLPNGMTVADAVAGDKFGGSPVKAARPNFSRQVIQSLNLAATEVAVIPTAGISVGTRQYVNFMSVSQWGAPGQWSTWTVPRTSIRPSWFNTVPGVQFVWGDQNFQMGALPAAQRLPVRLRHGRGTRRHAVPVPSQPERGRRQIRLRVLPAVRLAARLPVPGHPGGVGAGQ
ncbi:hypothetical protein MDOR_24990 [Mycolicibacterium doricum]|uniref:DUF4185 domain-containing protein n=1 Tax=Mycolicibacterium doricum TaxID=126673 RepID=A0A7I7VTJ1_9MYCO|nr:hypothetical protein MDOR_24990 [Mycolicibacterium doricum]